MYLVISTLPHVCSILPLIKYYKTYAFGYINIIVLSTILSILYHTFEESNYTLTIIDYVCAGLWVVYDIYMGYTFTNRKTIQKIIFVNTLSFLINILIPYNLYYPLNHSIWHLLNAYKCYYVSNQIRFGIADRIVYASQRPTHFKQIPLL
jgi:hypothetical protein